MISFESDYINGAHPKILEKLLETNNEALSGYGTDKYCLSAIKKIKDACGNNDLDVYFISGGTQTNQLVISSILKPYEGVISASTGHIGVHEAGAIEYSRHKVLTIETKDGKISAEQISEYIKNFYDDANHEHMVFPGMVYLSFPTEIGTIYSKKELEDIYNICKENKIILFIDGARLGYGLCSKENDLDLKTFASLCDVFYIGGTKVGALCGEALVFKKEITPKHFIAQIKQHGALLAKGRLLGIQFDTLFTNNLYFEISKHAMDCADKLKEILKNKGYKFFIESPTNQQFVIVDNKKMEELKDKVKFSFWEKYDDSHTVIRFVTSWSTTEEDLLELDRVV